jgi:uncharacterized BrkB/YihY/UPF0761 family membrane protein
MIGFGTAFPRHAPGRGISGGALQALYLVLAAVGFAIPISLLPVTVRHGNMLLLASPAETVRLLFANYVSAAFAADLLWVFVVFCIWIVAESRSRRLRHAWGFLALAFLFGVSGPLPLFLWHRSRSRAAAQQAAAAD